MPSQYKQCRKWCFTINNPTEDDNPELWLDPEKVRCATWQLEEGGNLATPHYQGMVMWKGRGRRLNGMKELNRRAHFEEMKHGTLRQNWEYCRKESDEKGSKRLDGPWQIGEEPPEEGRGSRNDLKAVKRKLDEGATMEEIWESHFQSCLRYAKGFREYRRLKMGRRHEQTKVIVVWGPPGSGKTTLVAKLAYEKSETLDGREPYVLTKAMKNPSGGMWWEDYDGEEVVIIEEFEGWISRNDFKSLVDKGPYLVPKKGTSVHFLAKYIFITSNRPPNEWWNREVPGFYDQWPEVRRRLLSPVGTVYRAQRNEHEEPSEEFNENFTQLIEDPDSTNVERVALMPRVSADADI